MKILLTTAIVLLASAAFADDGYEPVQGTYKLGSKTVLYPPAGEKTDTVRFYLTGKTAADIWKTIPGKPKKDECSELPKKTAGELVCLEEKPGDYRCDVGINLRSGKAVGASVC